jgi:hypothetical protein
MARCFSIGEFNDLACTGAGADGMMMRRLAD